MATSKGKALSNSKEGTRYTPAHMPKGVEHMSHESKSDYYKHHKGHMVSNKVNPKTGKYFNTY